MDKNLTVEIFVPTLGSQGEQGNIGTGYPVGRDLLMTARHVLAEDRDLAQPIEIRWRHPRLQPDEAGWRPIDEIVWESGEDLDVALIKASFPQAVDSWGFLSAGKPEDPMEWVSEGFAKAGGKAGDERRRVAMQGTVCSAGDLDTQFELLNRASAETEKQWQGASGSPVFVGRRIIGVIVTCPDNFNAARLRATPCWKLLQDDSFRTAIGYDDQLERRRRCKSQAINHLKKSPKASEAIAAALGVADSDLVAKDAEQKAGLVAERLLELEAEALIDFCHQAQHALKQQERAGDAAAVLSKTVRMLLPRVYDFGCVQGVRSSARDIAQGFVSLPVSIRTVAEIVMAGVDDREARYRNSDPFPEGAYSLPLAPEGGWDESGEAFQEACDTHLVNLFGDGAIKAMRSAWDDYMIRRFSGAVGSGRRRTRDQLVGYAADELEYRANKEHQTHYFVFDLPEDEPARTEVNRLITDLKARYPAVAFLNLDTDADRERDERRRFRPLSAILSGEKQSEETP